jgi:carbonic anhydrase
MHATSAAPLVEVPKTTPIEKPQNGIGGLKHWRQDILAGLVVSLISLPFSLGIAVASGAPPITGITSAIIAGFVLPFLGGSYVTISGPAAGLAPILLASMVVLGRGDLATGYPLLLVAICFAGCMQLILAKFKMARFSAIFPTAVVEGMLCAIGLLIIVKQFPFLLGVKFHAHAFHEYVTEVPTHISEMKPTVFIIGVLALAVMFALSACKAKWLKVVPPQVIAVVFGSVLGLMFGLSGSDLINIPANPLSHGIQMPDFRGAWNDTSVWTAIVTTVITLTLIDGIESLATVMAIDKIDPFHRKSDPNRTLYAMGVSNIVSSMAGGLTIIPGGVKSTACIMSGGRTQWANFYNACFLLVYLLLARPIINLMPYSVLGAMLIFTGYKLCQPKVWKHVAHIGWEQLAIFTITVVATLSTDLLWGIISGISAKFLLASWLHLAGYRKVAAAVNGQAAYAQNGHSWLGRLTQPLRSPVARAESIDDAHHIYFTGPLVSFNLMHVTSELSKTPATAKRVFLHVTDNVTVVDHTSCESLFHYAEECHRNGTAHVELVGLDQMAPRSEFPTCMRTRHSRRTTTNGRTRRHRSERGVTSKQVDPDDGMTWLSLSEPAVTTAVAENAEQRVAEARAAMDWLDLERASGGAVSRKNATYPN